jgi:chromosome segregation ATPase
MTFFSEVQQSANEALRKQESKERDLEKAQRKLKRLSDAMIPIKAEIEKLRGDVDNWITRHSELGLKSMDEIRGKVQEIQSRGRAVTFQSHQKMIASEEKVFRQKEAQLSLPEGGIETVAARYKEQDEKMASINREVGIHETNFKNLASTYKFLNSKYLKLRDFVSGTIALQFEEHCANKEYKGKLTFDHEKKTLVSKVDTNSRDGAKRDNSFGGHKQLSGGENSYSNVCLLLALSSVSPCPWQVLDEFDVFMYASLSMRLLSSYSRV